MQLKPKNSIQFISFSIDPLQGLNHMDIEMVRSTLVN